MGEAKTGNEFIDFLEKEIQPLINEIVKAHKAHAEKEGRSWSDFDTEYTELGLKYDLFKALGKYTKPTDKLMYHTVSKSKKGSLTIDAIIDRDGERYPLYTEVIYAGGYNIQRLHFRYITKTKLPSLSSNPYADKIKSELQRLSKGDKIKREIEFYEKAIIKHTENIKELESESDEETLRKDDFWYNKMSKLDWDEIVRRGADKNYDYDKNKFEQSKEEYKMDILRRKKTKIQFKNKDIESYKASIKKLQSKLDALVK